MASTLRLANIKKTYSLGKNNKQEVLKDINASFEDGELVAILGESGCGKSTLLNILGGLDTDYSGSIVIRGTFIRDLTEKEMDDYRKKKVGLIFQNYNLINHMSIIDNVEIAMTMSDIEKKERHERALDLLSLVGLKDHVDKLPNQLSGGQKQRVAIARALANNPSIILADEPTGALDKESGDGVMEILSEIAKAGKLVIIVTHSAKVASLCSRVITLDQGSILSDEMKVSPQKREYKKYVEHSPRAIKMKDTIKLASKNIKNKFSRNFLVSLGMSIGIAAIIVILCLSKGLSNYVEDVYKDNVESLSMTVTNSSSTLFTSNDLANVKSIEGVLYAEKSTTINTATYTKDSIDYSIGKLSGFYTNISPSILYGTLPSTDNYVIINEVLASSLSSGDSIISVIGTSLPITYNGTTTNYKIGAIYNDVSNSPSTPNVLLNSTDLTNLVGASSFKFNTMYVKISNIKYIDAVKTDIAALNFTVYQEDSSASTVLDYIDLGTNVLTGVAFLSMIVSAIMIIIVLYISIIERMQEIGILRSIGSRKKDIRRMFFSEAFILGGMGGIFGSIIALVIVSITNIVCYISLDTILISYNPLYYILGITISIIVSSLAGIAPANKAANLDPIDALRAI